MTKLFKILSLFSFLVLATNAKAGLLIEPLAGYAKGGNGGATEADKVDYSGIGLGGRIGFDLPIFQAGATYEMVSITGEAASANTSFYEELEFTQMGVFAGLKLGIVRLLATYYINTEYEASKIKGSQSAAAIALLGEKATFTGSSGIGIDLGFSILPMVGLNISYRNLSYDKVKYSIDNVERSTNSEASFLMFGVSFPLTI